MIRWIINKHMPRAYIERRMDILVTKRFLSSWNLEAPVDEPVMQKMFVPDRGFVEKKEYLKYLEYNKE